MSNEQLMLWDDIPMPEVPDKPTYGQIQNRLDELSRNSQSHGDEYRELLAIAKRLLDYIDFHQSNNGLLEIAVQQQDGEIVKLRNRLSAMKQEADMQNAYFREHHK